MHPQARDAAVGDDVEPQVGPRAAVGQAEVVVAVAAEFDLLEDRRPLVPAVPRLDRTVGRKVPREEAGVDIDTADHAAHAELDGAPVVAGGAFAPRLPAVHPLAPRRVLARDEDRWTGLEQIGLRREEIVARRQDPAADAHGRQIGE